MILRLLVCVALLASHSLGQDDRLIDVRQIMKDTFDIIRSAPAPTGIVDVSKLFPATQAPSATTVQQPLPQQNPRQMSAPPRFIPNYGQIQLMRKAQAQLPLTPVEIRQLQLMQLQQAEYQQAYQQWQAQQGQQTNQAQYGPNARTAYAPNVVRSATPSPLISTINRIFAVPTETDMDRLIRLPGDILYKMASEGRYIDPENGESRFSKVKDSDDRSSSSSRSAGGNSAGDSGGLFGNGFSFNVQGDGDHGSSGGNPFLKNLEPKMEKSEGKHNSDTPTIAPPMTTSATPFPDVHHEERKPEGRVRAELQTEQSKPYLVYVRRNPTEEAGEWQLVIPGSDNKPAMQVPFAEIAKLSESVARMAVKNGVPIEAPKAVLDTNTAPPQNKPEGSTVTSNAVPVKSAFVQEPEPPVTPKTFVQPAVPASPAYDNEINVNGQRYKLVNSDMAALAAALAKPQLTESPAIVAKADAHNIGAVATVAPEVASLAALAARQEALAHQQRLLQRYMSNPSQQQVAQTSEMTPQEQILLLELQQRALNQLIQRQKLLSQQASTAQTQAAPVYVLNDGQNVQPSMMQALSQSQQAGFVGKVEAPVFANSEGFGQFTPDQMPIKVQQKSSIPAAQQALLDQRLAYLPAVHIDPQQEQLPKQKQYSLAELGEYYDRHASQQPTTPQTTEAPQTTPSVASNERVYGPHKQVTIKLRGSGAEPTTTAPKIVIVDATADAADRESARISKLRQRFMLERQQVARKSKVKFDRTSNLEVTTPRSLLVTEHHCYNIRSFARQFGTKNIHEYAVKNCRYIENYYPDLKCENVAQYMEICDQYYSSRRMLFN